MKIIRNGICFIEREDIDYLETLPQKVCDASIWNEYYSEKFKFLMYKDKFSVQYFKTKDDIMDYDCVKDLSTEELELKIKELKDKLENLSLKWLNSSQRTREKLNKDKEYNYSIKTLKYYIESLNKYTNNKESYDNEISLLPNVGIDSFEENIVQGPTKKLSLSRSSKKYLEKKEGFKSEPISDLLKSKLEEANERANEKISINNSVYNQSNAHSKEHVLVKKLVPNKK